MLQALFTTQNENVIRISDHKTITLSDHEIITRVLSGEKELYEVIVRRYNQPLFRVIRSYLKNEHEVEDAMQEAYIIAYEKLYQFRGEASFSTWLIRIGINEALKHIRKRKKEKNVPLEDNLSNEIPMLTDGMNPEKKSIQKELSRFMEHAIDNLPEKYRIVFVLRELEGKRVHEVAECLSISQENVKIRTFRAKEMLKSLLLEIFNYEKTFEFGALRCDAMVFKVMSATQKASKS